MLFWHLFIAFAFIIFVRGDEDGKKRCFNCVSTNYMHNYLKFLDVLPNEHLLFPLEKWDCSTPKIITCSECFGLKIEDTVKGNTSVGFVFGCSERIILKKDLRGSAVTPNEKLCVYRNKKLSYAQVAEVATCRCLEDLCNNPSRNFIDGGCFFVLSLLDKELLCRISTPTIYRGCHLRFRRRRRSNFSGHDPPHLSPLQQLLLSLCHSRPDESPQIHFSQFVFTFYV